eukprot:gene27164-2403_t
MGKGGDSTLAEALEHSETNPTVLEDARFAPFLQEHFNVSEFTSLVLGGSHTTAQAQSDALRDGVRLLDTELSAQVVNRNADLLTNVRKMLDTESSLQDVVLSVDSLQSAIGRIRSEIVGPYDLVRVKTRQLRNLHATVDTLRHLIHRLKLVQKLKSQLAAPSASVDLAKAAKLLTDVRAVDHEVDLSGIKAAAASEAFLAEAEISIHRQVEEALAEGMESLSQAKVGSALQVYFNLDELEKAVSGLMSKFVHELEKHAKSALDHRHLSAGLAAPPAGRTLSSPASSWQDKLWQSLKELMEHLHTSAVAVWHLQRVVSKKKDPLSHVCFLDVLVPPGQPLLTQRFWTDAVKALSDAMVHVAKPSKAGQVRDVLISCYPRLAHIFESMYQRLAAETTMKGVIPAVVPDQLLQLLSAAAPFQTAYMNSSLSRMSDAVMAAFPGGSRSLPSPADVQKCIGVMHEELKVAGSSPQLASNVATTVGVSLRMLAEKAEYMATAVDAIAPIFKAMMESLEEKILKMHYVNYSVTSHGAGGREAGSTEPVSVVNTSAYLLEACALITAFRSDFLSKFVPVPSPNVPSCVGSLVERMACRLLTFFVRPLNQTGKLQVAKDMAELQLCIGQQLFPLEQLGPSYRVMKAFRALLFQSTSDITSSPMLKELPHSIILHHLFSRLPSAVQAPHERSGLTPSQYSTWLDQHSVVDVLSGVSAALDAAALSDTEATHDAESNDIITIMRGYCQSVAS